MIYLLQLTIGGGCKVQRDRYCAYWGRIIRTECHRMQMGSRTVLWGGPNFGLLHRAHLVRWALESCGAKKLSFVGRASAQLYEMPEAAAYAVGQLHTPSTDPRRRRRDLWATNPTSFIGASRATSVCGTPRITFFSQ